jgi:hypothetical protein
LKKPRFISFLFILIFASSASATVHKWVDKSGVVNFADDYSNVPVDYRNKVEELDTARMEPSTSSQAPSGKTVIGAQSQETAKQPPPVAQRAQTKRDEYSETFCRRNPVLQSLFTE